MERPGIIWVKLISLQGDGTYTVQEADADNVVRGPTRAGVKISAPEGIAPVVIPSTKPYPAYHDHSGNLVFFFNPNYIKRNSNQVFTLDSNNLVSADNLRVSYNPATGIEERAYIRFTTPITVADGRDNFTWTTFKFGDQLYIEPADFIISEIGLPVNSNPHFTVRAKLIAADFQQGTINWANKPATTGNSWLMGTIRADRNIEGNVPIDGFFGDAGDFGVWTYYGIEFSYSSTGTWVSGTIQFHVGIISKFSMRQHYEQEVN